MADDDNNHDQPETSASTPNSTNGTVNGLKAAKDKSCPFCGQAFTSSSLGRHLDLYIKPKNPKPPDGVHDILEIQKMRGTITRRQPRSSQKGKDDGLRTDTGSWSTASASKPARAEEVKITDDSPTDSPTTAKEESVRTWINAPNWQATGVINNLPARAPSRTHNPTPTGQAQRVQEMRRDHSGNRIQRPEYISDDMSRLQEAAEVGRAAEMALREVLGSLEAAKTRAEPIKLFDFDYCSLAFPGLCLAMLQPPPTLFSSTPFPVAHTWSLSPPGKPQYETCTRLLNERITAARNGVRDNVPGSVAFGYHVHLESAFEHWNTLSESQQAETWNLELARAFVRESEKTEQLQKDLEAAQQRNRHLEAEYDRLSRCQLPREYLLHPPNTIAVSPEIMKEMKATEIRSGAYDADYDVDTLLDKWRATVKATTRPPRPAPTQPYYTETTRNEMKGDMILNGSVISVNGPMPRETDMYARDDNRANVTYETPRNPGTVVSADEDRFVDADMDVDVDADGEADEGQSSHGNYTNERALTKLRSANRTPYGHAVNGLLNEHGKRPVAPTLVNGRASGPKIYREQARP